ncbi:MAG: caspase family protein, partial [Alphaproteobacteria bacterium]|nr:caspase family protein [Alphaproteobacteria bacterium]
MTEDGGPATIPTGQDIGGQGSRATGGTGGCDSPGRSGGRPGGGGAQGAGHRQRCLQGAAAGQSGQRRHRHGGAPEDARFRGRAGDQRHAQTDGRRHSRFPEAAVGRRRGGRLICRYAGHGVQVNGTNYLMPVDAEPGSEAEVEFVAIDLDRVLCILNATGTIANLLLLDACRNNPFEQKFRGSARGLARVESASGTLISYAAAPGTVAADGRGRNRPYMQAVLKALEEPGLSVEDVLKRVHVDVRQATGDRQTTWQEGQIVGRLVLNPEKARPVAPPAPAASPVPAPAPALDPALVELRFWESADRGGIAGAYEAYLARYPDGIFAGLAKA